MRCCLVVLAIASCTAPAPGRPAPETPPSASAPQAAAAPNLDAAPQDAAAPSQDAAPQDAATPSRDAAAASRSNVQLVADCATQAATLLGWNPVPDGAHHGSVIATSLQHGGSSSCAALTNDKNTFQFQVGRDVIDWDWEPKADPNATTIRYRFSCAGCPTIETSVTLPRRWHCFSWLEQQHHGTMCYPSAAQCEREHDRLPMKTDCKLHTGAAWCQVGTSTCSSDPWSCANNPVRAACEIRP